MIEWLDDFYADPGLRSTLMKSFLPVFSSYVTEATGGPVAASFVQALAESYVDRHLGSSRAQLQEVVKGSTDPLADLSRRFDEWEAKRPEKVASNELVRSANAAAVERMRETGVTKKVWQASGGSCPFCSALDGTVVEVERTFFEAGETFNPEGAESEMVFQSSIGHPPVHQGCDCSIGSVQGEASVSAEVQEQANDLVGSVQGIEARVTADLQSIGERTRGELHDLEFRVKSEASTARKIAAEMRDNPALSVREAREGVYDALRYTYQFEPQNYARGVQDAMGQLEASGYQPLRITDYWHKSSSGYASYQGNWKAPDGTIFELQFHTPATLTAKGPSHLLYEEWRVLPKGHSRRDTLQDQMDALWNPIRSNPPPGVDALDLSG